MRVLITDGNERAALAVTRGLGQQQIQVLVGAEATRSLAAMSRYCWQSFTYPSPYTDPHGFVLRLSEVVKQFQVTTVFPMTDIAVQLIGENRQDFDKDTAIPVPSMGVFEQLTDKCHLMQLATTLGVPTPETIFVPSGRVEEVIGRIRQFPVVVKPARSVIHINGGWCKTAVHYAASSAELHRLYREVHYLRQPSLIQHRVEGEGQAVFALMDHGKPVALFAHRRLREKPPSGGVSVLRESIALPQPMTDYALRLLEHVGWHGVAMVEFKVDRPTGLPLLLEVNGRFWGSLQLALDAGVNFPYLLCHMATGGAMKVPVDRYRVGVKSRWLLGDLDHLLLRLMRSDRALQLPPGSPSKWQCFLAFCRVMQRGMHYEVERLEDPGPSWCELRQYFSSLLRANR